MTTDICIYPSSESNNSLRNVNQNKPALVALKEYNGDSVLEHNNDTSPSIVNNNRCVYDSIKTTYK